MKTLEEIVASMTADIEAMTAALNKRTEERRQYCEAWAQMLEEANAEYEAARF